MKRIQLIHWNTNEAKERVERIRIAGYEADYAVPSNSAFFRQLAEDPPAAIVIDLSRLPSQGRDIALLIRKRKTTRRIPLVFIDGASEKVERIKELLPDAVYTSWERIGDSLREAILNPPTDPVAHKSQFAAYSNKSVIEKLGIKAGSVVGLIAAPEGFIERLGELPEGAQLRERADNECDLFIWFTRSREELNKEIKRMAALTEHGPLWIVWQKKTSSIDTDLTQQQVREVGLAAGLVDYKICSVDKTWSGLLFTRRKS
ncbi:MAG: DUF3052 family protein [Calditrichaeota bacterium]|nr:DUF3052 family protein [Calditrichota bacterium]